ncbi:MAG: TIGR00180 family glycosyltransferase [Chloroflexi bacterium]|nr:TIGR00180 family glycosyltransferase [Chloroflexota bacterium]
MNQISLFTPTKNRPEFVARLLRYYQDIGFTGPVLIGDSSDTDNLEQSKSLIEEMGQCLDVQHHEMPGLNGVQCVEQLIELVTTPYAAFVADDDYLVPSALYQCAEFLEENPDYSAAHGLGFLFSV